MKNPVAKVNRKINRIQIHRDRTKAYRPKDQREWRKADVLHRPQRSWN